MPRLWTLVRVVLLVGLLYPVGYLLVGIPHLGWIDFYQIFTGVQDLWRGENPYLHRLYYYPPWTALPLAPLVLLPYDPAAGHYEAAEAWFWLSLAAYLGTLALWLPAAGIRLRSLDGALLILLGLLFAPTLQSLIHGQSIPMLLLAVAALGTVGTKRPLVAGLALAALTIKPQVSALVLGGFLLRSLAHRSFGPLLGFAGVMASWLGVCFLLLPTWPWDWLGKLPDGHLYTVGSPAIHYILLDLGVPSTLALAIALSVAVPLGLWYAWLAWAERDRPPDPEFIAFGITLGLLAAVYSHAYDYLLALLPGLLVVGRLYQEPPRRRAALGLLLFVAYLIPMGRFLNLLPAQFTLVSGLIVAGALVATHRAAAPAKTLMDSVMLSRSEAETKHP